MAFNSSSGNVTSYSKNGNMFNGTELGTNIPSGLRFNEKLLVLNEFLLKLDTYDSTHKKALDDQTFIMS